MNKSELRDEIIFGLPSKKMLQVANSVAVVSPITDELIILKSKYQNSSLPDRNNFELYNEYHGWDYDYKELEGKDVIIDIALLNNRGKDVLNRYHEAIPNKIEIPLWKRAGFDMDIYTEYGKSVISEASEIIDCIDDGLEIEQIEKLLHFIDSNSSTSIWFKLFNAKLMKMKKIKEQLDGPNN